MDAREKLLQDIEALGKELLQTEPAAEEVTISYALAKRLVPEFVDYLEAMRAASGQQFEFIFRKDSEFPDEACATATPEIYFQDARPLRLEMNLPEDSSYPFKNIGMEILNGDQAIIFDPNGEIIDVLPLEHARLILLGKAMQCGKIKNPMAFLQPG